MQVQVLSSVLCPGEGNWQTWLFQGESLATRHFVPSQIRLRVLRLVSQPTNSKYPVVAHWKSTYKKEILAGILTAIREEKLVQIQPTGLQDKITA